MGSLFMPDHYTLEPVAPADIKLASIAWGFTLGFSFLTAVKAAKQTIKIWRRTRRPTTYIILAWGELIVSTIFGFICYFYLDGQFPPSFAFFFSILTLWALQVQFLLQIIINRIALLIPNKRKVFWIKWGVAGLITAINISVYCIWVPARLQVSDEYVHINEVWDRCEKGIYLVVDGILNAYFLRLVKTKLIAGGMNKYKRLFNFNSAIVIVSLSMDVLIIAMMSLPNTFVYMQFHPVAYIVKLNIEMSMAELISKVAREHDSGVDTYSGPSSHGKSRATGTAGHATSRIASYGHSRIMSHDYADGTDDRKGATGRLSRTGAWNSWGGAGEREYKAEIQGPRGNINTSTSRSNHRKEAQDDGVFDDRHESHEMDLAQMLRGDGGVIMKTVEVQVSNSGHTSDTESTQTLKDRV